MSGNSLLLDIGLSVSINAKRRVVMSRKMSIKKLKKKKSLGDWVVSVRKKGEKKGSEQASLNLEEEK